MATSFRALVMLSMLVGLPAAWIYYGPLPPKAQRVADRLVSVAREAIGWAPKSPMAAPEGNWLGARPESATSGVATVTNDLPRPAEPTLAPGGGKTTLSFAERVEPLLARLRQFGVVEYVLEPWGDGGKLYRFHCEMPVDASAALTRQFEAVAADPQLTVEQVVAEVADWRLARHRGGM